MLPQYPPKDRLTPLGQNKRQPTAKTARPFEQRFVSIPSPFCSFSRSIPTCYKRDTEACPAQDPSRDGGRAEEVRSEVRRRQTSSLSGAYAQRFLEVRVEDIEKAVCEAPEEEQDGDWAVECQLVRA